MFSHVSWTDYLQTVFWSLAVYYSVVLLRYYRQELAGLRFRRPKGTPAALRPLSPKEAPLPAAPPVASTPLSNDYPNPSPLVQHLRDEVAAFIREAARSGFDKEALLTALTFILSKYSSPAIVLHREAIEQWIEEQCRTHSSVRLSESDRSRLWKS